METKDVIGFAITFAGMAYGFGKLSNESTRSRKDMDKMGDLQRDTLKELGEINKKLERIDQRVIHCEKI